MDVLDWHKTLLKEIINDIEQDGAIYSALHIIFSPAEPDEIYVISWCRVDSHENWHTSQQDNVDYQARVFLKSALP